MDNIVEAGAEFEKAYEEYSGKYKDSFTDDMKNFDQFWRTSKFDKGTPLVEVLQDSINYTLKDPTVALKKAKESDNIIKSDLNGVEYNEKQEDSIIFSEDGDEPEGEGIEEGDNKEEDDLEEEEQELDPDKIEDGPYKDFIISEWEKVDEAIDAKDDEARNEHLKNILYAQSRIEKQDGNGPQRIKT